MSPEERVERAEYRHSRADARWLERQERKDVERNAAIANLGQLCREGKVIYYVYPVGGRYRESANPLALLPRGLR